MDSIAVEVETPAPDGGGGPRRKGRSTAIRSQVPEQRPFVQPRLRYAPTEVISEDEVESIHDASLRILEDIGMDFLCPESRSILAAAGADVRPGVERVRFDRNLILDNIAKAPEEFTLHARNPDHNLQIGRNWVSFGSVASAPNVADLDRGRRVGNHADYKNLVRLSQMLTCVHFLSGYPVEPIDIHHALEHPGGHLNHG